MTEIYDGRPMFLANQITIEPRYGLHCLYMPIKMIDTDEIRIPLSFQFLFPLIDACLSVCPKSDRYIYLSYECSFVRKGIPQKRPGIHSDGFMTSDLNFIWYDKDPTVFYKTRFEITKDHKISMEQFEAQAKAEDEYTFPVNTVLCLDEKIPHRVAIPMEDGVRQFFKLSISADKYNLKGNTHNPLFAYEWEMFERSLVRNHPIYKEADSVPAQIAKGRVG